MSTQNPMNWTYEELDRIVCSNFCTRKDMYSIPAIKNTSTYWYSWSWSVGNMYLSLKVDRSECSDIVCEMELTQTGSDSWIFLKWDNANILLNSLGW